MAKPIRFTPIKSSHGWRINVPAKVSENGERRQLFFRTKKLADESSDKFKRHLQLFGAQACAISARMTEEAVAAANLLEPYGIGLLEAAKRVANEEQANAASMDVGKALKEYLHTKEGNSERYLRSIGYMARDLANDFSSRPLSTINDASLLKHIEERTNGSVSFNHRLTHLKTFWSWASRPPRRWCNSGTLSFIEKQKANSEGAIETLTPDQAETLLRTAEKHFPDCVAPLAIALFTGTRMEELKRLSPEDIKPEGIEIPKAKAKSKKRRFSQMPDPLKAWLTAYPIKDSVCPANWDRKQKALRRLAGWKVWSDLVATMELKPKQEAEPPEDAPEWPQNALRHTAASIAVALKKPIEMLIFEHGHSKGTSTLRNHYLGCMSVKDALAIWKIEPKGSSNKLMKDV